jgi:hypothetical protein
MVHQTVTFRTAMSALAASFLLLPGGCGVHSTSSSPAPTAGDVSEEISAVSAFRLDEAKQVIFLDTRIAPPPVEVKIAPDGTPGATSFDLEGCKIIRQGNVHWE